MSSTAKTIRQQDDKRTLPNGWRVLPLGDTGEVVSGVTLGRVVDGEGIREVPYMRVANVKDGYLDLSDITTTPATLGEIEFLKLRQGDLLLTEGGDPDKLGRGALWEDQCPECIHQNHIFRVRLNRDLVEPAYAAALIGSAYGKNYFLKHAKQTTGIASINQRVLKAFPVLLPPLTEQRRIAGVLREQMAAVEKARVAAQARLEAAMALHESYIRESLVKGKTSRHSLSNCLIEVRNGVGPDWSKYPVLGATRGGIAPAKEGVGNTPERYKFVDPITVFYNPMRILLGSIAMVDEYDAPGITSPDYVVVKGRPGVLDTRWFYYWFRSTQGAHLIDSLSRGAVRERILFNRLAAGEIELPDYETQKRASARMKEVKPAVEAIKKELIAINALPAALLRRAFSGEC